MVTNKGSFFVVQYKMLASIHYSNSLCRGKGRWFIYTCRSRTFDEKWNEHICVSDERADFSLLFFISECWNKTFLINACEMTMSTRSSVGQGRREIWEINVGKRPCLFQLEQK